MHDEAGVRLARMLPSDNANHRLLLVEIKGRQFLSHCVFDELEVGVGNLQYRYVDAAY